MAKEKVVEFFKKTEACDYLGVTVPTVNDWIVRGYRRPDGSYVKLVLVHTEGGSGLVTAASVKRLKRLRDKDHEKAGE